MDYQKAIKELQNNLNDKTVEETPEWAIVIAEKINSALEVLVEYQKLGTLEELKKLKECEISGIELTEIACNLNRLKVYQQLGTLQEVREAVEKQNECKNCGYKIHSERISKLNSCNDCGLLNTCVKRPEYGEYCRINCYDWRKMNEMS